MSSWTSINSGPSLPALCRVGDVFITTIVPTLSVCNVENEWTQVMVFSAGSAAWGAITGTLSAQTDLQAALDTKGTSNFSGVYADLSGKPTLGTAAATAIGDYATSAQGETADSALQPSGNGGSLTGLTKTQVGLANVDNTPDASKPISTATQTALDSKQPSGTYATGTGTASGTNTGDQSSISGNAGTATALSAGADRTKLDGIAAGAEVNVNADWNAGSGDAQVLNKPATFAPSAHATTHQNGGSDEISVAGLSGLLADSQTPLAHKTSHQDGGADELALDASQTTTGQFTMARLASGTPDGSKFIRDDGTLVAPTASAAWGGITGTLSAQTDLQAALDAKQATLVSGTNIKTVNGSSVLGSGNLAVSASDPSYTPGSFTVATGTGRMVIKRMQLLTTERATVAGTARLRVA